MADRLSTIFFFLMQVALHFVKDEKTRFGLALECGNIEVCYTRGISVAVHSVVEILTL